MNLLQMKTEGPRADRPRNVSRLWLKVETQSSNGATIEGHWVRGWTKVDGEMKPPEPWVIEVYLDRLDAVLERVRTEKHRAAYKLAAELAEGVRKEWIDEHRAEVEAKPAGPERDKFIDLKGGNLRPEHQLRVLGYKTGIPPLEYCKVVNPRTLEEVDAFDFMKLTPEQRAEFIMAPPRTTENAHDAQADTIARAIERAFSRAPKGNEKR